MELKLERVLCIHLTCSSAWCMAHPLLQCGWSISNECLGSSKTILPSFQSTCGGFGETSCTKPRAQNLSDSTAKISRVVISHSRRNDFWVVKKAGNWMNTLFGRVQTGIVTVGLAFVPTSSSFYKKKTVLISREFAFLIPGFLVFSPHAIDVQNSVTEQR